MENESAFAIYAKNDTGETAKVSLIFSILIEDKLTINDF